MTEAKVRSAAQSARVMIARAEALLKAEDPYKWIRGSKESAALRRASMDLTRSLADLRRSDG